MKFLFEKLRLLSVGALALTFFVGVTLSSCTKTATEGGEDTEQVEGTDEHPAGEHPMGDEEAPADSVAADTTAIQQ